MRQKISEKLSVAEQSLVDDYVINYSYVLEDGLIKTAITAIVAKDNKVLTSMNTYDGVEIGLRFDPNSDLDLDIVLDQVKIDFLEISEIGFASA